MLMCRTLVVVASIIVLVVGKVDVSAEDNPKSVVLKDRSAERNFIYIKRDNSAEKLWDAFMVVKKANSGDPVAQHELGLRYLIGEGFSPDTQRAAYWIQKAAQQNLTPAHFNFGILLNNGWGVAWNPFEAYGHFQYAAAHGMPEAEYVFGLLMTDNLIVTRNYHEAYHWLTMAADTGYEPAKKVLVEFKLRGINVDAEVRKESNTKKVKDDSLHGK